MSGSGGGGGGGGGLGTLASPSSTQWSNTYGLSPQFLDSIGITGPLANCVFVANVSWNLNLNLNSSRIVFHPCPPMSSPMRSSLDSVVIYSSLLSFQFLFKLEVNNHFLMDAVHYCRRICFCFFERSKSLIDSLNLIHLRLLKNFASQVISSPRSLNSFLRWFGSVAAVNDC